MAIRENNVRDGNFTSSEIEALTVMSSRKMTEEELKDWKEKNPKSKATTIEDGFGDRAFTYIAETNIERRLGRPITDETKAKAIQWGKLLEPRVFDLLGVSYKECSQESVVHPLYDYWAGSPDGVGYDYESEDSLRWGGEIKCPMTLKSFAQLVNPLYDNLTGVEAFKAICDGYEVGKVKHKAHNDGKKFYWQCVSNSILLNVTTFELIVYMPYKSELKEIRELARKKDMLQDKTPHFWIQTGTDDELPWLPNNGFYKNLNKLKFEVPQEDIKFITDRVVLASQHLIPR